MARTTQNNKKNLIFIMDPQKKPGTERIVRGKKKF